YLRGSHLFKKPSFIFYTITNPRKKRKKHKFLEKEKKVLSLLFLVFALRTWVSSLVVLEIEDSVGV
ncbi:hypothetical protein CUMW_253060, partial [Citrus unshiu]